MPGSPAPGGVPQLPSAAIARRRAQPEARAARAAGRRPGRAGTPGRSGCPAGGGRRACPGSSRCSPAITSVAARRVELGQHPVAVAAVHQHVDRQQHACPASAGPMHAPRPVHEDHRAVRAYQQVVGPDVAVREGLAGRSAARPRSRPRRRLVQVGGRPRVEVGRRVGGEPVPAGEVVRRDGRPRCGTSGQRRRRERGGEARRSAAHGRVELGLAPTGYADAGPRCPRTPAPPSRRRRSAPSSRGTGAPAGSAGGDARLGAGQLDRRARSAPG